MQECIEYLERHFGATIQEETIREENVHFPLPRSLRELLPAGAAPGASGFDRTGDEEPSGSAVSWT